MIQAKVIDSKSCCIIKNKSPCTKSSCMV